MGGWRRESTTCPIKGESRKRHEVRHSTQRPRLQIRNRWYTNRLFLFLPPSLPLSLSLFQSFSAWNDSADGTCEGYKVVIYSCTPFGARVCESPIVSSSSFIIGHVFGLAQPRWATNGFFCCLFFLSSSSSFWFFLLSCLGNNNWKRDKIA